MNKVAHCRHLLAVLTYKLTKFWGIYSTTFHVVFWALSYPSWYTRVVFILFFLFYTFLPLILDVLPSLGKCWLHFFLVFLLLTCAALYIWLRDLVMVNTHKSLSLLTNKQKQSAKHKKLTRCCNLIKKLPYATIVSYVTRPCIQPVISYWKNISLGFNLW